MPQHGIRNDRITQVCNCIGVSGRDDIADMPNYNASENLTSLHKRRSPRSDYAGHGARSLAGGRDHACWHDP
jgi:hypothetical protein